MKGTETLWKESGGRGGVKKKLIVLQASTSTGGVLRPFFPESPSPLPAQSQLNLACHPSCVFVLAGCAGKRLRRINRVCPIDPSRCLHMFLSGGCLPNACGACTWQSLRAKLEPHPEPILSLRHHSNENQEGHFLRCAIFRCATLTKRLLCKRH